MDTPSRGVLYALGRGLIEPSSLSLGVAGASCAIVLAIAAIGITEANMAGRGLGYLVADPYDDYGFATGKALRMRRAPIAGPQLAIIGAGATRESFTGEDDVADRLEKAIGRRLPVHDFTTGAQSAIEMAALAESLGPQFEGVLVLGVSPNRLSASREELTDFVEQPRLGFVSAAADEEIRAAGFSVPMRTGVYLIDNYQYFVARHRPIVRHLVRGPVAGSAGRTYLGRPAADATQWSADAARLKTRLAAYDARVTENLASIARLLARLPDRRRVRVVLLEIPFNPRVRDEIVGAPFLAAHRERLERFARDNDLLYWDLGDEAALTAADFQDWSHLNSAEGQRRYTTALVARLAPLFASR